MITTNKISELSSEATQLTVSPCAVNQCVHTQETLGWSNKYSVTFS